MSSDLAIEVRGISKQYRIGALKPVYGTLRDRIVGAASGIRDRLSGRGVPDAEAPLIWALKNVSFDVPRGEVVGIVGGNGAGKSTLLKILSRITEPTEGEATLHGRVGSLLEVGTGFHSELTGRENTFLYGAILGMSRAEVTRKFDAIVDFAGVGQFIDTPVRFYSSGMYMRLAFAVAAHLEAEILVVDEALAVGDTEFQKRCLGKMNDISAREGRTILFVSHHLEAVQRLCSRGLLLRSGRLEADGPIGDVIASYRAGVEHVEGLGQFNPASRRGVGWARFTDVRVMNGAAKTGRVNADDDLDIELDVEVVEPHASLRGLIVEVTIASEDGAPLCSLMNVDDDGSGLPDAPACTVRVRIPGPTFAPGAYRIGAYVGLPTFQDVDDVADAVEFEVAAPRQPWRPFELNANRGRVCRAGQWSCSPNSVGAAGVTCLSD